MQEHFGRKKDAVIRRLLTLYETALAADDKDFTVVCTRRRRRRRGEGDVESRREEGDFIAACSHIHWRYCVLNGQSVRYHETHDVSRYCP